MTKHSSGVLVYRIKDGQIEVLIAHPGGPYFVKKDEGIWTIPKGLNGDAEEALDAAKREFEEEMGQPAPKGEYHDIGEVKRKDGKVIKAWAVEGDIDETFVISNTFTIEWPPRSGKQQEFPEVDRAQWFDLEAAVAKLQPAQVEFLERLAEHLGIKMTSKPEPPSQSSLL